MLKAHVLNDGEWTTIDLQLSEDCRDAGEIAQSFLVDFLDDPDANTCDPMVIDEIRTVVETPEIVVIDIFVEADGGGSSNTILVRAADQG